MPHSLQALEIPNGEEDIANNSNECVDKECPVMPHAWDCEQHASKHKEPHGSQGDLDQKHTTKDPGDLSRLILALGDRSSCRKVKAIVGEDVEVLRESLRNCYQAISFHTEDPDKVRKNCDRDDVIQPLQKIQRNNVVQEPSPVGGKALWPIGWWLVHVAPFPAEHTPGYSRADVSRQTVRLPDLSKLAFFDHRIGQQEKDYLPMPPRRGR
jgi:hypothetical protein